MDWSMIKLLETTVWKGNQENHVYYVNGSKDRLVAFEAVGGVIVTYNKPLRFNTRGRTFRVIK
jgi:hypothetical protein